IVDEDLALASALREGRREECGVASGERFRAGARQGQARLPLRHRSKRNGNVQALAAGCLDEAFEIDRPQQRADGLRCRDYGWPGDLRPGIEIQDDAVRILDLPVPR